MNGAPRKRISTEAQVGHFSNGEEQTVVILQSDDGRSHDTSLWSYTRACHELKFCIV